ncbi:MAG: heterodisulfide reductase-related iron-sulfur binding cluster [Maricaulaceae bacterium]|jgi:glycerol-3-phosphate dehydrogenase subunit C
MAQEGSLEAPTRHVIDWRSESYYDEAALEAEMTRVFDICHGCRRCFNLCDAFPQLFDMIDESDTFEVDGLDPKTDYKKVADACTLCDMCFMTKCPYVPPHEFDLDFPHMILRQRAIEHRKGKTGRVVRELAKTDRNGKALKPVAPLANALASRKDVIGRKALEAVAGVAADAELPKYHARTLLNRAEQSDRAPERETKRKAVVYATCYANYNEPHAGEAALAVLAKLGVETEVIHPACCGMPFLEHGDIPQVAQQAEKVADAFAPYIADGYDVIALTASCGLMLKFEWPLIAPGNEAVKTLSAATRDICQYVVEIAKDEGLPDGLSPVEGGVAVHMACHARAQNMGPKAAEMLRLIPNTKVDVIERCSGHGGTFGVMKDTRPLAVKVARPAVRAIDNAGAARMCSDCPLACKHLAQVIEDSGKSAPSHAHPIEIFAEAYGLV